MKIYSLLTGKKNSTLKNKNIIKILNQRIFLYPAKAALSVKNIKGHFTSSDSNIMLKETLKIGFNPIKRPKILSKKNSKHRDVLLHSLKIIKLKYKIEPDVLIVLLANSPTIKSKWIKDCLKMIRNKNVDAVVPVLRNNDHHPIRAKQIKNGFLIFFFKIKKNTSTNRQDLTPSFFLAHNFWVIKTKNIYKNNGHLPWAFMGKNVVPFEIKESIDIHEINDVDRCRKWLSTNNTK